MKLKIVTPERVMLETEAESVTIPTTMGEVTVLANHIPMVANIQPGELRYVRGGKEEFLAISGGFLEIRKHSELIILADSAEFGHEIDLDRAEKARLEAQKFLTQIHHDESSMAAASAAFQKHLVRIRVARKHRTFTHPHVES